MREVPLVMPKMSMTMVEGSVLTWHKSEGEPVRAGEVVCEVMTDKVDMEVESPVDGTLTRIVAAAEATVPVGEPMAYLATEADALLDDLFADTSTPDSVEAPVASPPSRQGPKPAVPRARRRAAELGVRIDDVTGTGPNGVVTVHDVDRAATTAEPVQPAEAAAAEAAPEAPVGSGSPAFADALGARRQAIRAAVNRTVTASAAVPQFTVYADLELDALEAARGRVGWTALFVRALALALREHPDLHALWQQDQAVPQQRVGVAIAVDTAIGLLAPVVPDPDRQGIAALDARVRAVVDRARSGRLSGDDLAGATTTLSNLGGFGVAAFQALLTPPQATALSLGAVEQRPVVRHGGIAIRTRCTAGLTVDHRIVDGADAARLLATLREVVADPSRLLG
ncbi:MAG: dihydrolipoamide acetyltransferase family protein [Mycobacteriales bacterium]